MCVCVGACKWMCGALHLQLAHPVTEILKKNMPSMSSSFRELPPDNNEIKFSCLEKNGLIRFLHRAQLIGLVSCK